MNNQSESVLFILKRGKFRRLDNLSDLFLRVVFVFCLSSQILGEVLLKTMLCYMRCFIICVVTVYPVQKCNIVSRSAKTLGSEPRCLLNSVFSFSFVLLKWLVILLIHFSHIRFSVIQKQERGSRAGHKPKMICQKKSIGV